MRNVIITYSNGDIEQCVYSGPDFQQAIKNIVKDSFNCAWFREDEKGDYIAVTNMNYVRSIEIVEVDHDSMEN